MGSEEEELLNSNLTEAHLKYFFGDITSMEAGEILREEDIPGSFLLRKNGNGFKLSWDSDFFGKCAKYACARRRVGKIFAENCKRELRSVASKSVSVNIPIIEPEEFHRSIFCTKNFFYT